MRTWPSIFAVPFAEKRSREYESPVFGYIAWWFGWLKDHLFFAIVNLSMANMIRPR
jgi:hypothetical protein